MLYYKVPINEGHTDCSAGSFLCCAYPQDGYMVCKFESVAKVGSGWVKITAEEFEANCPEFPAYPPNDEGNGTGYMPIAYLYNGVELPALPSAAEDYPYLCIYKDADEDLYWLWGSKSPIYIDTGDYGDTVHSTKPCIRAHYKPGYTVWDDVHFDLYLGGQILENYTFVWCNNRIKKGNAVVHNASAPVPVYPESGGGSGGAKVIDLDNYTTADGTKFGRVIQNLLLSGEHVGSVETDLTQFFEDATTDGALILKLNVIMADIFIHGVTACCHMDTGVPQQMSFMCFVDMGTGLKAVIALFDAFTCDGRISLIVSDQMG